MVGQTPSPGDVRQHGQPLPAQPRGQSCEAGSGSHASDRVARCRSTSCGGTAGSSGATSSWNSAIPEKGEEVASNDSSNQPSINPVPFYFSSDRLVIIIIRLVVKHLGRDWGLAVE